LFVSKTFAIILLPYKTIKWN